MQKISIIIGVVGLLAIGWFLVQESSIDYVATVDDELTKLESELAALDSADASNDAVTAAKNRITTRLGTINASLTASQDRALNTNQQQMLDDGLVRLQQILVQHQTTLATLDQSADQTSATNSDATIEALTQTIRAIQEYLDIPMMTLADSPRNATYIIAGSEVTLVDGVATAQVASGSAEQTETRYFGNEVQVDLNNDGREDTVFLLTQSTGGSGTFFYVVAALNTETGWQGLVGFLLGDRIAPQTTELSQNSSHQNVIVVNYIERALDEPMTTDPSVGVNIWLKLDPTTMTWGEVSPNVAGGADTSVMNLTMQPWTWVQTTYGDGTELAPTEPDDFTLTFNTDNTVSISTDCNTMNGTYETNDFQITFGPMTMTKMFCVDSKESAFATMLEQTQSYFFTTRGELVFDLKFDSGSSVFR